MPRFYTPQSLSHDAELALDATAARHVQVLRLQPGDAITLFNGLGGEFEASVTHMGRSEVRVRCGQHHAIEREASREVHLALGMPANERMDWLIEKATELGASSIQPLVSSRSVLRLGGEQAAKKRERWQAQAIAACEQCGRNRIPVIHAVNSYEKWLPTLNGIAQDAIKTRAFHRFVLSPQSEAAALRVPSDAGSMLFLSGPEGGLSPDEERQAVAHGFIAASLGTRILRAETAPLAALLISQALAA